MTRELDGPTQPPNPPYLPSWAWCVQVRVENDALGERSWSRGSTTASIDVVYDEAEALLVDGDTDHVAILLQTNAPNSWGVADTCERDGAWVVGRERWKRNHAAAVAEGRAS